MARSHTTLAGRRPQHPRLWVGTARVASAFTVLLWSLADIDECVTGIHNCSINETCFNIQGSFRCLAFECPENYRRSADT